MGFCILGGKENYLRKVLSDKLTSLGQTINIGATATAFASAIQTMYDSRYTAGQDSLKTARKLTLTSSQTGSNINIADNWYTTCDASAVYTAGQNSVKTSRKLTLTASQTGTNVDIADNWYTTCDASAVYNAGVTAGGRKTNLNLTFIETFGERTTKNYNDSQYVAYVFMVGGEGIYRLTNMFATGTSYSGTMTNVYTDTEMEWGNCLRIVRIERSTGIKIVSGDRTYWHVFGVK